MLHLFGLKNARSRRGSWAISPACMELDWSPVSCWHWGEGHVSCAMNCRWAPAAAAACVCHKRLVWRVRSNMPLLWMCVCVCVFGAEWRRGQNICSMLSVCHWLCLLKVGRCTIHASAVCVDNRRWSNWGYHTNTNTSISAADTAQNAGSGICGCTCLSTDSTPGNLFMRADTMIPQQRTLHLFAT